MGLFNLFKKKKNATRPKPVYKSNSSCSVRINEEWLYRELDMAMSFINAFTTVNPGEWYHFFVSPLRERNEYGDKTDYIEFKIMVGSWWDGMLYKYPEIIDYFKNVYTFDSKENTFTYKCNAISSNGLGSYEQMDILLKDCLDKYSATHPGVCF